MTFQENKTKKYIAILVSGVSISSVGDFIYLLALNISVLRQTHSAFLVAGLWALPKTAALLVGPWIGSISDRFFRRTQLIAMEICRAVLTFVLPEVSTHLYAVYSIVFLLGVCSTWFGNNFFPYQTILVPSERRKQVNALLNASRYGAFLIGPAIGAVLLASNHTYIAFWSESLSFAVSGMTFVLLPDIGSRSPRADNKGTLNTLRTDWGNAVTFLKHQKLFFVLFYMNALVGMLIMAGDSQEVVFATDALHLGRYGYAMMLTGAGAGFFLGALALTIASRRVRSKWLIGIGRICSVLGYLIYSTSYSASWAILGLIIMGAFSSSASVGLTTYAQKVLPDQQMGRIASVLGVPQQIISILLIVFAGYLASLYTIRIVMIIMSVPMCMLGISMLIVVNLPRNHEQLIGLDT